MNFNEHWKLKDKHAFLSASKYHWIRYDAEKLLDTYYKHKAIEDGTMLHAFASSCINLKQKLPKTNKTLNMFVNDALGYRMKSEQVLYYSDYCFGTADAISFKKNVLRIHDLKTGETPAHMEQLMIYAALFCLEYNYEPDDIHIILSIYQNNEINTLEPEPEDIKAIMDKIIEFDKLIEKCEKEEEE